MATVGRTGTGSLLLGGVVLALLMGYTLMADFWSAHAPEADAAEVAVFFPAQSSWFEFRQAAQICASRGFAEIVDRTHDGFVLRTLRHHRRVRFTWHGAQGQTETLHEIRRLCEQPRPPVAVVGSSNTLLTAVLAGSLADPTTASRPAPVLLTTEATADEVVGPDGAAKTSLLALHAGRTFRLGLENRRLARLATDYLADREGPGNLDRAFFVVDRDDPYSNDLAEAFVAALEGVAPGAAIPRDQEILDLNGRANAPALQERAWARRVWRAVEEAGPSRKVLVFLPLQEEPARRLLVALQGYGPAMPGADDCGLRVICGDAVGREVLGQLAGPLAFPVWAASSATIVEEDPALVAHEGQIQIPAEAIAALLACLDRPKAAAVDLAAALRALDLPADDRHVLGRRLAFDGQGERQGDGLGSVLGIEPGDAVVLAHVPRPDGRWADYRWDGRRWRVRPRFDPATAPVASRP